MSKKTKSPEINRLKTILQALDCSITEVAEQTGVSERTIKNTIWSNLPIGGQLLRKLHQCYGVSIDWLLSGEGEMFMDDRESTQPSLIPHFQHTDTRNAQDAFIVAATAIEQAMTQCGAKPDEDYTLLDLFNLASPFAVERYKESGNDLKFFD